MKRLDQVTTFNRPVYSVCVPDFTGLTDLKLPSSQSVILLVADASGVDPEPVYSAASRLIDRGAIYVCTWGPDCERVHDIFDEADIGDGTKDSDEFIMTTWHTDDSLHEAVEFFLNCAFPLDQHLDNCSWIVITVRGATPRSSVEETINRAISETETNEEAEQGPDDQLPASAESKAS